MNPITMREVEETSQIRAFFDEAAVEAVSSELGRIPDAVMAAMRGRVPGSLAALTVALDSERALAAVAALAFLAGRKAERAGLVFTQPPD